MISAKFPTTSAICDRYKVFFSPKPTRNCHTNGARATWAANWTGSAASGRHVSSQTFINIWHIQPQQPVIFGELHIFDYLSFTTAQTMTGRYLAVKSWQIAKFDANFPFLLLPAQFNPTKDHRPPCRATSTARRKTRNSSLEPMKWSSRTAASRASQSGHTASCDDHDTVSERCRGCKQEKTKTHMHTTYLSMHIYTHFWVY